MKDFIYKTKSDKLNGEITISLPKYKERLAMLKEVNFKYVDGEVQAGVDQIDAMIKMVDIVEKHVKAVKLIRKSDNAKFDSFEDLQYDKDGADIINEVGNVILSGFSVGKN